MLRHCFLRHEPPTPPQSDVRSRPASPNRIRPAQSRAHHATTRVGPTPVVPKQHHPCAQNQPHAQSECAPQPNETSATETCPPYSPATSTSSLHPIVSARARSAPVSPQT